MLRGAVRSLAEQKNAVKCSPQRVVPASAVSSGVTRTPEAL